GLEGVSPADGSDAATLREIERVLTPGGRALVTVPFGRREDHGWFRQYDEASWSALLRSTTLRTESEDTYALDDRGWRPAARRSLANVSYGDGSAAARAVLCAELRKPLA